MAKQSNTGFSISFFWPVHDRSMFGVNLYLARNARSVGRGPDMHIGGAVTGLEEKCDKIAGTGLNNVDNRNETPIVAQQSSQETSCKQQINPVCKV